MAPPFVLSLFLTLCRVFTWIIILRIVFSWFAPRSHNPFVLLVRELSEAILGPIRDRLPRGDGAFGMIDWSPLVALLLIDLVRYLVLRLLF